MLEGEYSTSDQELSSIVESEKWINLQPNYPSSETLLPRDLSKDTLGKIITTMKNISKKEPPNSIDLASIGKLNLVGQGGEKICYGLTTPEGKTMAVLLRGRTPNIGIHIPDDPKLIRAHDYPNYPAEFFDYSDLHTYLIYPVDRSDELLPQAVQFQEFGGTKQANMFQRLAAEIRVRRELVRRGFRMSASAKNDLSQSRHYLANNGHPAVIDVSVFRERPK